MKKLLLFAFPTLLVMAGSCTKCPAPATEMKTISVELGSPQLDNDTKTVLVGGSHVYWTATDSVIVCITTNDNKYLLKSDERTQKVTKRFTGTIPASEEPAFFFYEMNKTTKISSSLKNGHTVRCSLLNSVTTYDNDSFQRTNNFAIAKPGDASFKNVHGYFKWTNNGSAIKSVKFEALTPGEYLAGYFDVRYDGAEPVTTKYYYEEHKESSCSPFVFTKIGFNSIPADKSYYAVVIPGTYHGLKVTITLADGSSFSLKTDETIIVERGKYIDFGVLPIEPVTIQTGSFTLSAGQDYEEGWTLDF